MTTCPVIWKFAPQVTQLSGHTPPSTTPPVYTLEPDVVLTYPFVSPTSTLTIPIAPSFGDSQNVTVEATRNSSMNGVLTVGRNALWPIVEVFTFDFQALLDDFIDSYFAFLQASLGMEIGLRDHRNRQWRGYILNPDGAASQHQTCDSSIQLSFRGTLVS